MEGGWAKEKETSSTLGAGTGGVASSTATETAGSATASSVARGVSDAVVGPI